MNNSVERDGSLTPRQQLRVFATAVNDLGPVHLPRDLVDKARDFAPQVIHSLLGGVRAMKIASEMAERLDLPVVPHFMDDWVENLFNQGQLGGYARRTVEREFERVLSHSPILLTIGDRMRAEFEDRLHRPAVVVGNSVDFSEFDRVRRESGHRGTTPRTLRYVGGLHLGRDQVVRSLARRLVEINAGENWMVELNVPPADAALAESLSSENVNVHYGGSLRPDEVQHALASADALLFIESTAPGVARFTRLSVSTKVPQYLGAARPVLVLGPADQSSVQVLVGAGLGYHVESPEGKELPRAITALGAATQAEDLPAGARSDSVISTFGLASTRERLREALATAAETRRLV
ncbi:hypothetical protein [uncultured Nocardioides sp.]|uniref:hypothetical protein n=1 Tax=uncultured Nocardioides sp. TaxID=198441 RepID=UPI0026232FD4|nr:hypothetical protein [uncultured Nocardioides sp.]